MKHDLTTRKYERRARKLYACFLPRSALTVMVVPAFAADDPLTVVNKPFRVHLLPDSSHRLILLGFGVLQLGLYLKSHDPSQRANGKPHHCWRYCDHLYQGDPHSHYRIKL